MPNFKGLCRVFSGLALIAVFALTPSKQATAEGQTDWERWAANNPAETHQPEHKLLTTFLETYGKSSRGETAFAYKAMKGQGVKYLEAYINYLESIPVSLLNRDEQLAWWLNLYSAGVIHAIAPANAYQKV